VSGLVVAGVIALLVAVAAAGAVAPYRRGTVPTLEPLADPLEDRRTALAIALRDLEAARASGSVDGEDYGRLREDTEARLARVLKVLDERRSESAAERDGPGVRVRPGPARWVAIALVGTVALSVALVPSLLRAVTDRAASADAGSAPSLETFQERVRLHPHDVAARLDLAHRYLDAGLLQRAYEQYYAALRLDADNVEALAHFGILEHLAGRPERGISYERRALAIDPGYAEARFFEGVILLKGLRRPDRAVEALQAYLHAAPFGSEGPQARRFIKQAKVEIRRN
jgi:tetratricopeptide (TPR) repeat protein